MFSISLPIHLKENTNKYDVLDALKRADAEYAFIAFDNIILSAEREKYEKTFSVIGDIIPFLKKHGYKVGIWFWSLWLADIDENELDDVVMVSSEGKRRTAKTALNSNERCLSGYLCPTSPKIQIMLDIIKHAAEYSPDIILLNDDLGYTTYLKSMGCYCERHMEIIREKLGYEITVEKLREAVSFGERNEIRDAWLEILGGTLEKYALDVRKTIDSVDPSIRCGFCCVMSNWQSDGISVERIAKLMAGSTKPFIRLIGAPYWSTGKSWGNRLQHTVELIRMESSWIEDKNIELVAEGDVYPRPRYRVPAAFLEIYDTAIRASGCCDGILKIMFDYASSLDYERGYIERHERNRDLYDETERIFRDKKPIGVRVYERMNKAENADFCRLDEPEKYAEYLFFSYASRFLSDNTVPTTYSGNNGVGIAFGENARDLPAEAFENGLILDIRAARILMEQGVDVGIEKIGEVTENNMLYFPADDEKVLAFYRKKAAYSIIVKDGAEVITYSLEGNERYADTFRYENKNGQRFLVYAFDAAFVDENRYRNYCTQRQLTGSLEWLARKAFPAVCVGNPDLYMICKANETGMTIGLWNIFPDDVMHPVITLDRIYSGAEFIGCDGDLNKNTIRLSPIQPYGYAFINLKI